MSMRRADYARAKREAATLIKDHYVTTPPVPIEDIARVWASDIKTVEFKPPYDIIAGLIQLEDNMIWINKEDPYYRQRFTIAHELGHLILHADELKDDKNMRVLARKPIGGEKNPFEQEANCFAANLLVPIDFLRKIKHLGPAQLSRIFLVSKEVIGYRLSDLGWSRDVG